VVSLDNSASEFKVTADINPSAQGVVPPDVHLRSLLNSNMPQVVYTDLMVQSLEDESGVEVIWLDNSASEFKVTADSNPSAQGALPPDVHLCLLLHFCRTLEVYTDCMLHFIGSYTYLR